MIREKLFRTIQRVWKLGVRNLWADAVCINQSDTDEVVQQVIIMRQIYELARGVIAHLGESLTPYSHWCIRLAYTPYL